MPKVTVFIPVYNTERYISQAIESIINQTYSDWELIVLDDCSTDNTYSIISEFARKDVRIKVFRNEKNLGMMPNWNRGLPLCKSQYWGKLDADDFWAPTMIEDSLEILENDSNVALVCSTYLLIDQEEKITQPVPIPDFATNNSFDCVALVNMGPRKMFQYNILRQGIGLMRRAVFDELGLFTLLDNGDTEMWFRIGCHYKIYCINKTLHYHRIWSESFMRKNADENEFRKNKNFFDVRMAILNYYNKANKISDKKCRKYINDTKFIFNTFRIYMSRKEKKYIKMVQYLLENFRINFFLALDENLHIRRLFKK